MSGRAWLITGGCGFIGTSLIGYLLKEGLAPGGIRVLDNLTVGSREDLALAAPDFKGRALSDIAGPPVGVELTVGDIREQGDCMAAARGVDVIVHLAANTGVGPSVLDPVGDMKSNVMGTLHVLEAARASGVKRFVFASSGAPAGDVEPPITERVVPKPVSPYGVSKLAGEGYCSAYFRTFGISTVALRFGNAYGPMSIHKESVVAKFFKRAMAGEPLEIYGDGSQTRDYIYIEDIVRAIVLGARKDVGGEVFQIATHRETTLNELAGVMRDLMRKATGIEVSVVHAERRLGDVARNYSDITKARQMLGWEPRYELAEGLALTLEYFLSLRSRNTQGV